ncbi:MAG TPA: hypothetical protein VJI12_03595 [archaeon]|nr:hypothetical protein [archaeon]
MVCYKNEAERKAEQTAQENLQIGNFLDSFYNGDVLSWHHGANDTVVVSYVSRTAESIPRESILNAARVMGRQLARYSG